MATGSLQPFRDALHGINDVIINIQDMGLAERCGRLTDIRYSAARFGLLKLALIALITSVRSKPMSHRATMALSSASPERNELVLLNPLSPAGAASAAAGAGAAGGAAAGEGAAGTAGATGATGATGAGAGAALVEGAAEGVGLGYGQRNGKVSCLSAILNSEGRTLATISTRKSFSLISQDSMVFASGRTFPKKMAVSAVTLSRIVL